MPEYRRFVAYFYEYINGKKQKNAGFAKVELRNGMWRILFRLTTEILPESPIQVYGFVREQGYLSGILFGTMRSGRTISEEWAYRAEHTFGDGGNRFEDLSGIWIQSGDGRIFITVWDDEEMNPDKFVPEQLLQERIRRENGVTDSEGRENEKEEVRKEEQENTLRRNSEEETEASVQENAAEKLEYAYEKSSKEETEAAVQENITEKREIPQENKKEKGLVEKQEIVQEHKKEEAGEVWIEKQENKNEERAESTETERAMGITENVQERHTENARTDKYVKELFEKRQHFLPFDDQEITDCVQILPCDIVRLQQADWQVGRSSFLQHGFYLYRHLLFGIHADGTYVLGVPGLRNQQEDYMAHLFGFDHFKRSKRCDCGRIFGYWWKRIEQKNS